MASISETDEDLARETGPLRLCACAPLDRLAVGLSGACVFHCLALPALAAALPVLGVWAQAEWVHVTLLLVAAPLSAAALLSTGGRGRGVLTLAGAGLALMALGALAPASAAVEIVLTVAGSLMLAAAHIWNGRRRAQRGLAC
jgi:hypothetical protein